MGHPRISGMIFARSDARPYKSIKGENNKRTSVIDGKGRKKSEVRMSTPGMVNLSLALLSSGFHRGISCPW